MIRRTSLAPVSPRKKANRAEYERAAQQVLTRDRGCKAAVLWPEVDCHGRIDPHHVFTRRMYPERVSDPDAMVAVCRAHHDAIHSDTPLARQRGLLQ